MALFRDRNSAEARYKEFNAYTEKNPPPMPPKVFILRFFIFNFIIIIGILPVSIF